MTTGNTARIGSYIGAEPNCDRAILAAVTGEFRAILGDEFLDTSESTLTRYGRSCSHEGYRPIAVLSPASATEVQKIVSLCQRHSITVYPLSRGRNSGYGSASPSSDNCVILDLRRMNSIIKVDEGLAFALIEPGVTQAQLQAHLEKIGSRLWVDVTGAAPDSSLIGNLIERGYGLSPYGDRFLNSCGMEVVLPTGEIVNTGFGHIPHSKATHLYKWGIGPYVDGLFTQSNFGIITKVGLWLMPKPETAQVVSIVFKNDEKLIESIEQLRDLKLKGLFPSPVHIANDLRVISVFQNYPFAEMNEKMPLSAEVLEELKKRWQVGAWNCIAGLWGTNSQVKSMRHELCRALRGIVRPMFVSRKILKFISGRRWLHWLPGTRDLRTKMGLLKLLGGVPSSSPQNGGYWRKRSFVTSAGPDLERDECGIIWVSPIVPSTRADLANFISSTRKICAEHTFETNVTVSLISDRATCCTVAIIFDRSDMQELSKAERCHSALLDAYLGFGFPPYRAGSDWRELLTALFPPSDSFAALCSKIKDAIDPNHILSPGRYGIW